MNYDRNPLDIHCSKSAKNWCCCPTRFLGLVNIQRTETCSIAMWYYFLFNFFVFFSSIFSKKRGGKLGHPSGVNHSMVNVWDRSKHFLCLCSEVVCPAFFIGPILVSFLIILECALLSHFFAFYKFVAVRCTHIMFIAKRAEVLSMRTSTLNFELSSTILGGTVRAIEK